MNNIKNLKVRLLSLLTALTLAGTPVIGKAESENSDGKEEKAFTLVKQEKKTYPLTMEEFIVGVEKAYEEASKHISYGDTKEDSETLYNDVKNLYYLINRSYISQDVEKTLLDKMIIKSVQLNIGDTERLIRACYNHDSLIIKKGASKEDVVDLSHFCFNENDKDIVSNVVELLVESYKNGKYNEPAFNELFKTLTTLNTVERLYNADAESVGSRCISRREIGELAMLVLRYSFVDNHEQELDKYFEKIDFRKEVLNRDKWVLRDDVEFNYNCLSELEFDILRYGQLTKFCVDDVYTDLATSFVNFEQGKRTYNSDSKCGELTIDEFEDGFDEAYEEVIKHLDYGMTKEARKKLKQAVRSLYYLTNVEYISSSVEEELKNKGYVYKNENNQVDVQANLMAAIELCNLCFDQIQSSIKYISSVKGIVDLSKFCYQETDACMIKEVLTHLVKSYYEDKIDEKEFKKFYDGVMKISTSKASVGVRYLNDFAVGSNGMQVLRFYFDDYYLKRKNTDIYKYFQKSELDRAQWFLKDDVKDSIKSDENKENDELKKYVKYFDNLWDVCYTHPMDDIFEYLNTNVKVKTK